MSQKYSPRLKQQNDFSTKIQTGSNQLIFSACFLIVYMPLSQSSYFAVLKYSLLKEEGYGAQWGVKIKIK